MDDLLASIRRIMADESGPDETLSGRPQRANVRPARLRDSEPLLPEKIGRAVSSELDPQLSAARDVLAGPKLSEMATPSVLAPEQVCEDSANAVPAPFRVPERELSGEEVPAEDGMDTIIPLRGPPVEGSDARTADRWGPPVVDDAVLENADLLASVTQHDDVADLENLAEPGLEPTPEHQDGPGAEPPLFAAAGPSAFQPAQDEDAALGQTAEPELGSSESQVGPDEPADNAPTRGEAIAAALAMDGEYPPADRVPKPLAALKSKIEARAKEAAMRGVRRVAEPTQDSQPPRSTWPNDTAGGAENGRVGTARPSRFSEARHRDGLRGQDATSRLTSAQTRESVSGAFDELSRTILNTNPRTFEDLIADLMRPMLREWLDTHLPDIVERQVRAEIEQLLQRSR